MNEQNVIVMKMIDKVTITNHEDNALSNVIPTSLKEEYCVAFLFVGPNRTAIPNGTRMQIPMLGT